MSLLKSTKKLSLLPSVITTFVITTNERNYFKVKYRLQEVWIFDKNSSMKHADLKDNF